MTADPTVSPPPAHDAIEAAAAAIHRVLCDCNTYPEAGSQYWIAAERATEAAAPFLRRAWAEQAATALQTQRDELVAGGATDYALALDWAIDKIRELGGTAK